MRRAQLVLLCGVGLAVGLMGPGGPAGGKVLSAEPGSGTVTVKDEGSVSLSYEGEVPPGTGSPTETCEQDVNADIFVLEVKGTGGNFYSTHNAQLVARIDWDPATPTVATNDLALLVRKGGETLASSDGGEARETALLQNPEPGTYRIVACAFSNVTPQPYLGKIFLNSTSKATERLPRRSPSRGLRFMPIVTVDPQRDVAEPSLRIDKGGNLYTCGPFGASRTADYAQKSEDGGDTFRVLGEPPEGRIAISGGGDCEIAVSPKKNDQGHYNLAYTGLEALLNFSTGRSVDGGRTFESSPSSAAVPLVDRQWLEAHGENEVYLFYNQVPFGGTLQRSTDGGLTYAPASSQGNAAPNIYRPGNIVIDHNPARNPDDLPNETIYIAYTLDNKVKIARSTDQGQTFERFTAAVAKGNPSNLFPSLTIDKQGTLYVAWTEKGSFNTYYAYSKRHAVTKSWSNKRLVNRKGVRSTVMPWIEAGSPGRVAVSFYCSAVDGNVEVGGRDGFKGPWHVCVNQSQNALSRRPDFSQVRATHHPIHWDSICLSGLGCSVTNGDRTLLDFFQLRPDPRTGRLFVVFNESNKKPRADAGLIAIVTLVKQKSGPSLFKSVGRVKRDRRGIVRSTSRDRKDDARFDFSSLGPPPPRRDNVDSLDIRKLSLKPTRIMWDGERRRAIAIKLKIRGELTDAALTETLLEMESQELKFVVRWFSAYRPDYVVANWRPGIGFEFFEGNLAREVTADGKLEIYPAPANGRRAIPGNVNLQERTITMKMPYLGTQDFDLGRDLKAKSTIGPARPGDKIFEVTAFTFGRPNVQSGALDYYNQADSTASFDYRLRR